MQQGVTIPGTLRTTCPYCGVGCGVLATVEADGGVRVSGDPQHPANFGRPPKGAASDSGRTICACFGVGEKTILHTIREQGLNSVESIGQALKAGTGCGSCVPELRRMLGS